jgi:hypothetical protein
MPTDDVPAYGPYAGKETRYGPGHPANRRAEAIREVEALSQRFAAERAQLVRKHAADEAAEARRQDAARVAGEEAVRRRDEELAPVKAEAKRQFVIAHPEQPVTLFETKVWPAIRDDEARKLQEQQIELTTVSLRASGRYNNIL